MSKDIRKLIDDFKTFNNNKLNENEEKPKKVILKDGAYVAGYTSNGEHYVLLYDDKWKLYTGYGKFLTNGKIKSQIDYDYIVNLGNTSEQNISQIIKLTSNKYQEENQCSLWDINNGLCDDFAQSVIEKMGGYTDSLYEISGDMFFNVRDIDMAKENWGNIIETEYGVWSVDLLKHWGYPPDVDLNLVDNELNHTWIYFNGKHYDAEAPNGVDKWYDLPLNKKFFNRFKERG